MRPPRPLVPDAVRVLRPFVEADVLEAAEVALAEAVVRLAGAADVDDRVILAIAVAGLKHVEVEHRGVLNTVAGAS